MNYLLADNLLVLLAVHTVICLLFSVINIKRRGLQDSFFRFLIVFLLPVSGFLFFAIKAIAKKTVKHSEDELEGFLDSVHGEKHIYHEEAIDFENEINTIPMGDSLEFSDDRSKRAYLIYILKKDFSSYIGSLQKAIRSKDSETSHYAAAALMEIKKEYEVMIVSAGEEYSKSKKNNSGEIDILPARNYAGVLNKYIESGIADEIDYYDYLNKYSELLEFLIKEESEKENYFMAKISADIKLGDHERAFEYCKMFAGNYPENENSYLAFLKLFYVLKDHSSFNKVISLLKKKNIHISEDMLNKLEFWEVA